MRLLLGDCVERMRELDADSVDAVVTDPPYELGFMAKAWDTAGVSFQPTTWREAHRVLKPGGHLLAFGGSRTVHRIAVAIEDAGFEVRDMIVWLYGSGFPKSLDVAKAIDSKLGATGELGEPRTAAHADWIERGSRMRGTDGHEGWQRPWMDDPDAVERAAREYLPATEEARARKGWGTALKPALEPIVVARKPLIGTVAENVLAHGTGAINVDACRIEGAKGDGNWAGRDLGDSAWFIADQRDEEPGDQNELGRWPANLILDEEAAAALDEQSGELVSGANPTRRGTDKFRGVYGDFLGQEECAPARGAETGGASRFYYCAKTSRIERNAGLDEFEAQPILWSSGEQNPGSFQADGTDRTSRNHHPTVKPVDLMRWLVRLVTPPVGTVLDPFLGSGTTGIAAALEGFDFIGIEREPEYLAIAEARIGWWEEHGEEALRRVAERDSAERVRQERADAGQLDLFATEGAP